MRTTSITETNDPTTSTTRRWPRRIASFMAAGTLMLGAAGVGSAAAADASGPEPSPADTTASASAWRATYVGCMHTSAGTPDALEHYVAGCAARATALFEDPDYTECERGLSADAAERWSLVCADRAIARQT